MGITFHWLRSRWDSSVGIVTRLQTGQLRNRGAIVGKVHGSFLCENARLAQFVPSSYQMGTGGSCQG